MAKEQTKKPAPKKAKSKAKRKLSPDSVMGLRRLSAALLIVFAIIVAVSLTSYFFHWKSVIEPVQGGSETLRLPQGGRLGYHIANLFVHNWFGFAAIGLFVELCITAVYLWLRPKAIKASYLKLTALTLSATYLSSVLMGLLDGSCYVFGTGLGGAIGHDTAFKLKDMIGFTGTFVSLIVLCVVWLAWASNGFYVWLVNVGADIAHKPHIQVAEAEEPVSEPDEEPEDDDESEPDGESLDETPGDDDDEYDDDTDEPEDHQSSEQPGQTPAAPEQETDPEIGVNVETIEGTVDTKIKEELPWIDPRAELPNFQFPTLELLEKHNSSVFTLPEEEKRENIRRIIEAFANFKIEIVDVTAIVGPTVTLYQLHHGKSVTVASIKNRSQDIAIALHTDGVRVVIQEGIVGIEVPNKKRSIVPIRATLNGPEFRESKAQLPIGLGYTITQKNKVFDLTEAPHLLVAGATQQGKSVGLNVIITSLLYAKHPSELKFVFIDPKMVEFNAYRRLYKHYLAVVPGTTNEDKERQDSIITTPDDAYKVLKSLCIEMDERYKLLADAGVQKITLYNARFQDHKLNPERGHKYMPYLVCIVDEYADLTMSGGSSMEGKKTANGISEAIIRLAQKGRAAGIHVILATQSPRVQVVTGLIKTNFPTRIGFRVATSTDSMTILGTTGAEKLIGKGDMLYYAGMSCERVQCAYISNDEIDAVTGFIEKQSRYQQCYAHPYYLPVPESDDAGGKDIDMTKIDDMFEEAARTVVRAQTSCSVTFLQRKLGIGYARAAKIMDQLEAAGIVGPQDGSKPRNVLIEDFDQLQTILDSYA